MEKRQEKLEEVYEEIEKDLTLLGIIIFPALFF